jgi:hypothetical protein
MVSTAARGFSLLFKLFLKEHRRQDFSPPPVGCLIRAGLTIVNAGWGRKGASLERILAPPRARFG